MTEIMQPIPARLKNVAVGGHVAGADQIIDDEQNKTQETINNEVNTALGNKANKSEMSVTPGTGANADKTTIQLKSGTSATVLTQHQDISSKANTSDVNTALARKQDTINDLATIRSGATAGTTAQQPATTLAGYGITNAYTKSETYTKSEVNGLVDTPHQNYVTVATYASLPATGSADTIYRVSNYNGSTSQVDASVYSEYAWNGSQYVFLCVKSQIGEVFDISVYNNNAKYADLAAALNGGANIPQSLQKGGMSVKFIQSSDNKYVQYRLMAQTFSNTESDWQGVDDVPVYDSNNIVKSDGIYKNLRNIVGDLFTVIDGTVRSNGNIEESGGYLCTDYLPITGTDDIILKGVWGSGSSTIVPLAYYNSDKEFISALTGYPLGDQDITIEKANIPQGAKFIRCTSHNIVQGRAILGGVNINSAIRYSERLHQQSVEDMQEIFLNLRKKKVLIPSSVTEDTIIMNGEVETWNSVDVVNYDVTEGKSYLFSGEMPSSYSGFYFITWYNNNGQVVGGSAYITSSTYIVESLVVTAPAGAVTAKINRHHEFKVECWLKDFDGYYADLFGSCGLLPSCNVGDVRSNGIWYLVGTNVYTDTPAQAQSGFLRVSFIDEMILQEFIELSGAGYYKRSRFNGADFGVWQQISGSGNTYNVTNEFTNVEQTVNLTATPQISSDTNNYLAPSGDNTDRTADILAMLQSTGICRLGTGEYWVDSLVMPVGSAIIGSGKSTKVCLKSGNNKFAIKMNTNCVVKDISVIGSSESISLTSEIGTRHGILWQGNYTETQNTALQPLYGSISNVFIKWFTGGGITCQNTGLGTSNFIEATNVVIERCCVGLNVYYYSEFHKFTNVACRDCYYGCINNGGNNVFVNCDFSLNRGVGFLMDNSQGQSPNNSHGTCIGCEFHHNRTEELVSVNGIHIKNCKNGFIFNSCQISDKIVVENSTGISITSCNIFDRDISIDGGNTILLSNNLYFSPPATPINVISNQKVKVVNCYNAATGDSIGI